MFVSDCLGVNGIGHLTIGRRDTLDLAQNYGTPLYVMDENEIRRACRSYRQSIDEFYGGRGMVLYASKAFCCKEICRIVDSEGLGLDVVSGGELYTALSAGFPAQKIYFHGNSKTMQELTYAIRSGVGRIVVDNLFELELLNNIATTLMTTVNIQLRLKPGVSADTHDFVKTGGEDSKFGLDMASGQAFEAVRKILSLPHLSLTGIHCHIGSQIFDAEPFERAATVLLEFMARVRDELGYTIKELNLGGGYGIRYLPHEQPVEYGLYMRKISAIVKDFCAAHAMSVPFILMEPGRSIVATSGITLYTIGAVKEIPGVRDYVIVDGGMPDNPRYALYKSQYEMLLCDQADRPKTGAYTVAGRCCESGDLLGENVPLQEPHVGDILAVLATGAYNFSMASNYNRLPRPAVVMVGDEARVVVRRETYEDVAARDI